MKVIKQDIKDAIKGNNFIKGQLCSKLNKHMTTIERYIDDDDKALTIDPALSIISEGLSIEKSDILEEKETAA